ncbi:Uma2 family endonuclease [Streptacidiphilus sp. EB129]
MAVEVTSFDDDTERRDRVDNPRAYAEAGIPVYLLVDRTRGEVVVHTEPASGRYTKTNTVTIGDEVVLPVPVDLTLDTQQLKDFLR